MTHTVPPPSDDEPIPDDEWIYIYKDVAHDEVPDSKKLVDKVKKIHKSYPELEYNLYIELLEGITGDLIDEFAEELHDEGVGNNDWRDVGIRILKEWAEDYTTNNKIIDEFIKLFTPIFKDVVKALSDLEKQRENEQR